MKKMSTWFLLFGLLGLILSGCGTSEQGEDTTTGSTPPATEVQDKNGQDVEKEQPQKETDSEVEDGTSEEDGIVRTPETLLKYKVKNEQKEETAFLQYSDTMHYSMYVLPQFELTGEEPNKDVVMHSENGHIFMRIELPDSDTDWEALKENTLQQLKAVNENVKELTAPEDEFYQDAVVMEATTEDNQEIVTAYLVKHDKTNVKLTIFTESEADYKDAFLQMAKTIMKEK